MYLGVSARRSIQFQSHFQNARLQLPKPQWLLAANPQNSRHLLNIVEAVFQGELVRLLLGNAVIRACLRQHFDLQTVVLQAPLLLSRCTYLVSESLELPLESSHLRLADLKAV